MKIRVTTTIIIHAEAATRTQLAMKYKVHYKTFSKWLKLIPDFQITPKQKILTPKQVATIYKYLGAPD